ncbi:MAG: extracellular solute-binding protein [Henriciella sp.]|nr:extracellular solute-binding protein [Henriciella sp.]
MELSRRSVLAASLVPMLAACGVGGTRKKIVILGEDLPGSRALEAVASRILGAGQVSFVLDPYEMMTVKANTDFASRAGNYDVVMQYNTALAPYVQNDYIVPVSEFSDQAWVNSLSQYLFEQSWKEIGWYQQAGTQDAEPFGVPHSANSMLLCGRRELFEDADNATRFRELFGYDLALPTSWRQLEDVANFFTTSETRGIALQGAEYWNYYEWANFAFGNGGGVMQKDYGWISDENTPLILNSPETIEATERYVRLKNYSQYGMPDADFYSTDAGNQISLLRTGNYAMGIVWSDVVFDLVKGQQSWSDDFIFAPIPGSVSMLAGGSYYVNKRSKNIQAAEGLIQSLFDLPLQKELARNGLCVPRRDVYEDPELLSEIPYLDALGKSLARGVYMLEAGIDGDQIISHLSSVLQELFRADGELDVASRLDIAQSQISDIRTKNFEME